MKEDASQEEKDRLRDLIRRDIISHQIERNSSFWDGIRHAFSKDLLKARVSYRLIDTQPVNDSHVRLIFLATGDDGDESIECCEIWSEKRWFKSPLIKVHWRDSSGGTLDEFLDREQ